MYTAMMTLCLGMSLGQVAEQVPSDVRFINMRDFRLPFQHQRPGDIRELALYVSSDQGKSWRKDSVIPGTEKAFVFSASADGEYWLQVATTDKEGRQDPENIYDFRNHPRRIQKWIIDTHHPRVRILSAKRHGDEILVSWEIEDQYPDWSTFKLEYQVEPSPSWQQVQAAVERTGQVRIRPSSMSPVKIRLAMKDRAGNLGQHFAEVAGHGVQAQIPPVDLPLPGGGSGQLLGRPSLAAQDDVPIGPPPVLPPSRSQFPPPPSDIDPLPRPPKLTLPNNRWSAGEPKTDHHTRLVASSDNNDAPSTSVATPSRRPLPPVRFVNTKEVTLEYELSKVGPSGVGSVDLWWTQNDGETWEKYADDPDAKTPGRHTRSLPLPGDGVFGFTLVVRSRAGLGRREPRPGEVPDIRREVDTVPPAAQLFAPVPDPQRANSLILSWTASDKNLGTHPVNLEWAERRDGTWHPIALNIANTGRHSWQLPEKLPVQVYLRVRVRDLAGNEGIAATNEPQLVDLSEPEGKLLDVMPQR